MKNTVANLEDALQLISALSVTGDVVDIIAATKIKIREAISELNKIYENAKQNELEG